MDIIRILWKYPRSLNIIQIPSALSLTFYSSCESDWCITSFPVCNFIFFLFPLTFALLVFVGEYKLNPNHIQIYVLPCYHLNKS